METRRAFVVAFLFVLAGFGVALATPLEEEFVALPGWIPGIAGDFSGDNILAEHGVWHGIHFDLPDDGIAANDIQGREFLEFHRELLAQTDDYRIFSKGVVGGVPLPAVIPIVARPNFQIKFGHIGYGCERLANETIESSNPSCHLASAWVPRGANLMLGNLVFHGYSVNDLGVNIQTFHDDGHGSIADHRPVDMKWQRPATRDAAFWMWHKNLDNIYADWAVGKYQLSDKTGRPIFFSVRANAVGAANSALNARRQSEVYQGSFPSVAGQYGAIPRIGSDIYVGDGANIVTAVGYDNSNLLFAAGTHRWNVPAEAWDVDAWSILNPAQNPVNRWYFSVTTGSLGVAGTPVALEVDRGGDVFDSTGNNSNVVCLHENELGLLPTDELDAIEIDRERRVQGTNDSNDLGIYDRPKQYFSLRSGTTFSVKALGGADVTPSDILHFDVNGNLEIVVLGTTMGLTSANDDLDALAIVDSDSSLSLTSGDKIYYSLAAGSPALGANSAADILCYSYLVGACAKIDAVKLGLRTTDDLDALDADRRACTAAAASPSGISRFSPMADPPLPGACCLPSTGTCSEILATDCAIAGGTFRGEETVCATAGCPSLSGACCAPTGSCSVVTDRACADAAGTFRGPSTTCPPVPACTVPPSNDECAGAIVIPSNFTSGLEPPADNTNATIPTFLQAKDPAYSCKDPRAFSGPNGRGTLWYSYDVLPGAQRSILFSTQRAAQHYGIDGGAGDTRMALYYAPNGNCSVLQEVACADNIVCPEDPATGNPTDLYQPLRYDNPRPGRYYLQLATTYTVERGRTYLQVTDPPTTTASKIPAVTPWGLAGLTVLLMGVAAMLLRMRGGMAT